MKNKSIETIIKELTNSKKTLKQLGIGITFIRDLKNMGYNIKQDNDNGNALYWIKDRYDTESQVLISPKSSKIETVSWAEISDTHSGCIYFNKKGLDWFLKECQDRGIKHVHHSGDLIDGNGKVYKGQHNFLKYNREEDQVNDIADVFAKYNFDIYIIDGNHDMSFILDGAPSPCKLFSQVVKNVTYIPGKSDKVVRADMVISGVMKRMVHPWSSGGRATYAQSYPAQTYLRNVMQSKTTFEIANKKYSMGLCQYGHLHFDALFHTYGVIVTFPLTFQKGNDYTEGMGLGGKNGGRITTMKTLDGEILEFESKTLYVPEHL